MTATSLLLESTIKVSLVVAGALVATALLRRQSAALRHWVLAAAMACAALTPVLVLVLPSWHLPIGAGSSPAWAAVATARPPAASAADANGPSRPGQSAVTAPSAAALWRIGTEDARMSTAQLIAAIWLAGAAAAFAILAAGLGRLADLASRSRRVAGGRWAAAAVSISRTCGRRRQIVLLQSDHPTLLVTWGLTRARVLLPAGAQDWPEERVRIVLAHELAHIERRDWVVQVTAEVVRSIFWFNPLVWMACRRLRHDSEQAADDAVLNGGIEGASYATHLVELAQAFNAHRRTWLPAPAIVRPSSLERRVRAMLNDRINRSPATRWARVATIGVALALAVAVASAQSGFASLSGSVVDPQQAMLPGVTLVLTNLQSGAKHEVRTDRTGRYEFVGLPAGEYSLDTTLMGFAPSRETLQMNGRNIQRDLTLSVGSLQETITIRASASEPASAPSTPPRRRPLPEKFTSAPCQPSPSGAGIGGNLRAPLKLVDVKPHFPANLAAAGTSGVVVLEAIIGTDGAVRDLQTVSTPHPDFDSAAREAVRQWEFSQTLLNCNAIEVKMTVTVNFNAEP
jgi:TonB family protein